MGGGNGQKSATARARKEKEEAKRRGAGTGCRPCLALSAGSHVCIFAPGLGLFFQEAS